MREANPPGVEEHLASLPDPPGGPRSNSPSQRAHVMLLDVANRADLELTHTASQRLLHHGDDHFEHMLRAISSARRQVCLEMYEFAHDPVGWRICAALGSAAKRGVDVRVLLDSFGSARVRALVGGLRDLGVEARWYNPWRPWNSPFRRTHRKLLVADGELASVGGINLTAEFSEDLSGRHAFRDVGLWIEGAAVTVLANQFEAAWHANGGDIRPLPAPVSERGQWCAVGGGSDGRLGHATFWRTLAETARHQLLVATPYFLPDAEIRDALSRAAHRGVEVVVVVPRHSDLPGVKHAGRRLYRRLMQAGVTVWERCDRMVHAKVGVADGVLAAVGSANITRQSLRRNSETLLVSIDPRVVGDLHDMIMHEGFRAADLLTSQSWSRHPDRRRWAEIGGAAVGLVL